ncbi:MAG: DNA primase [Acidimicrobiales bacterium]
MGILPEDVARVRAASDLAAIAGEHVALKRVGRRYQGLCPFHAEKSPSFSVNAAEGLYYCFGCGARGDVITFVREVEHLEFAEAVERLAARAGIQLRYDEVSPAAAAERKRVTVLRDAVERAVEWYHSRLLSAADAKPARHYLRAERGYDGAVVREYRLGYAPVAGDALARALRVPDDVLREAGLGAAFRGRLLFPIFDSAGHAVGFGGRALPGGPPPKYRNSPETPLYKKSRVLYGLNWAKGAIVDAGEVVICEGYTDVIGLHQAGVRQAVATCGTALGEEQVALLKNFARRVVLAYDADAAGQAAAERVYEWERKFDIDVAVVAMAAGEDPADMARRDPEGLRAAVAAARPFLAFRLERVLAAANVGSVEGRARAAEAGLAVVAEHPNEFVRDQYVMQIADRTGIEPDRLRDRLRRGGGRPAAARNGDGGRASAAFLRSQDPHRAEVEALRVAIHRPEEVAERLNEALFQPGLGRRTYLALAGAETLHDALEGADPAVAALLQRLAVEDDDPDPDGVLAALADAAARRALATLEGEGRSTEIAWLKPTLEELGESDTRRAATDRLVRWLGERLGNEGLNERL